MSEWTKQRLEQMIADGIEESLAAAGKVPAVQARCMCYEKFCDKLPA